MGLTTERARRSYGLGSSGAVASALEALRASRIVVRSDAAPAGYAFDNPFFRGWVIGNTLPDLGISLPMTHLARARPTLSQPEP